MAMVETSRFDDRFQQNTPKSLPSVPALLYITIFLFDMLLSMQKKNASAKKQGPILPIYVLTSVYFLGRKESSGVPLQNSKSLVRKPKVLSSDNAIQIPILCLLSFVYRYSGLLP